MLLRSRQLGGRVGEGSGGAALAGAFLATLARQLAGLVASGKLLPSSALWTVAVDKLLLRATAVSVEVLEEVRSLPRTSPPPLCWSRSWLMLSSGSATSTPAAVPGRLAHRYCGGAAFRRRMGGGRCCAYCCRRRRMRRRTSRLLRWQRRWKRR